MPRLDHPALESLLKKLGQEHLLDHWPRLSAANQTAFAEELAAVDWELVREVCAEKYAWPCGCAWLCAWLWLCGCGAVADASALAAPAAV